jgi:hypothetical protein
MPVIAIAEELDQKLRSFDPRTAASVERLVRDALALAQERPTPTSAWPVGFWQIIREEWGNEPFERAPQGHCEK